MLHFFKIPEFFSPVYFPLFLTNNAIHTCTLYWRQCDDFWMSIFSCYMYLWWFGAVFLTLPHIRCYSIDPNIDSISCLSSLCSEAGIIVFTASGSRWTCLLIMDSCFLKFSDRSVLFSLARYLRMQLWTTRGAWLLLVFSEIDRKSPNVHSSSSELKIANKINGRFLGNE